MILSPEAFRACLKLATPNEARVDAIVRAVSEATGISRIAIYSQSRRREIAHARQIVMHEAHKQGLSVNQIARALNRDHTTILHGIRAEETRRAAL